LCAGVVAHVAVGGRFRGTAQTSAVNGHVDARTKISSNQVCFSWHCRGPRKPQSWCWGRPTPNRLRTSKVMAASAWRLTNPATTVPSSSGRTHSCALDEACRPHACTYTGMYAQAPTHRHTRTKHTRSHAHAHGNVAHQSASKHAHTNQNAALSTWNTPPSHQTGRHTGRQSRHTQEPREEEDKYVID
jgi:hypothetical protein